MKSKLFLLVALSFLSLSCFAQTYHNQSPSSAVATPVFPTVNLGLKKIDVSGYNIAYEFNQWTLFQGKPIPTISFTPGIYKVWGGGEADYSVENGTDTIAKGTAIYLYGFGVTGGLSYLLTQLNNPLATSPPIRPSFEISVIGAINQWAANLGAELLDVNAANKTVVKPSIRFGVNILLKDLFTSWTKTTIKS